MPEEPSRSTQLDLYDPTDQKPPVQYEMVKVPLQDQVSFVRKSVCTGWNHAREAVKNLVSSVRVKVQGQLMSVGVKNPVFVMQASAVGTAGLVGLVLARKRSTFHRISYPVVASGVVWGGIYVSNATNRQTIRSKAYEFKKDYIQDTQLYSKIARVKQSDSDKSVKR